MGKVSRKHPVLHSAHCRTQESILRTTQACGGGWEPAGANTGKCRFSVVKAILGLEINSVGNLLWRLSQGLPGLDTVAQALTRVLPFLPFPSKCQAA